MIDLAFDAVAFKTTKHILRAAEFVRDLTLRVLLSSNGSGVIPIRLTFAPNHFALATFRKFVAQLRDLPDL